MNQITAGEFWSLVSPESINDMLDSLERYPDCVGVGVYRSQALEDMGGKLSFMVFGPSNTFKTLGEAERAKPHHWSQGFESWCPVNEVVAARPPRFIKTVPIATPFKGVLPPVTPQGFQVAMRIVEEAREWHGVSLVRPVLIGFGKTVGFGAFFQQTRTHENDRYVQEAGVKPGTPYYEYRFRIAGNQKEKKTLLHWRHGLPYGPAVNPELSEWSVGATWKGAFDITEHVPMNFGYYKDELLDDRRKNRVRREELKVVFLD